ncbi:carbohydrate esterase family 8 protein [Amniculicola lignicola CBS 123094]|uniref:Pectinesterase n=1 Tax=Amniculicola lignicola CBS 123094 TaxID=1392246 RepID=A0A6A5WQV4_9PLEO|nr:carbohydrate esterase family 8 protein [Amniculicola lignicola CBS 123094]
MTAELAPTHNRLRRATRTTTPSGCKTVRGSGTQSGEFSTLGAALAALGTTSTAAACIFIYAGTYAEQLTINYKGGLTIYGYTTDTGTYKSNTVLITHSISSPVAGSLDASSTANIVSSNFAAYNVNFANTYGAGAQAVAVTANGNKQAFYGCSFKSYQDTLYAKDGDQYYSNCYIEGAVDYIFGKASAWFGECTIASNGGGAITASSRENSTDPAWYVFDHSTVTTASGVSLSSSVYLGRPWRVLARVIYQNCVLGGIINAAGWTTMAEGATPIYEEYANTGVGASTSARKFLTAATTGVTKAQLWPSSGTSWYDTSY